MDEEVTSNGHFTVVEGIRTHVRRAGKGKTLILLHGLGGPLMWQRVETPLSRYFEVVIIDLPGYGLSWSPSKRYSTEDYVNFLRCFLDIEGIQTAIWICVSYGGQIAVNFAYRYPERVKKIVLISSTGLSPQAFLIARFPIWNILAGLLKFTVMQSRRVICFLSSLSFYDIRQRPAGLCEKFFEQLRLTGHRDAWLNMLRNICARDRMFSKRLLELQTPSLIIWGKHDRAIPLKFAYAFHRLLTGSQLEVFPECAHSVPLEKPTELCEAVMRFANNNDASLRKGQQE